MNGLSVDVFKYKNGVTDCTNLGVTAFKDSFILVDDKIGPGPLEVEENVVYLRLVRRNLGGRVYTHAEPYRNDLPYRIKPDDYGPMFGGNFIYSCDSRFPNDYPIPVHDRFEDPEVYNRMD